MSDEEAPEVPQPPAGYIPGDPESDVPVSQSVGDRGEVEPSPDEVRQAQLDAIESGGGASPDTAAAGAEHKDR